MIVREADEWVDEPRPAGCVTPVLAAPRAVGMCIGVCLADTRPEKRNHIFWLLLYSVHLLHKAEKNCVYVYVYIYTSSPHGAFQNLFTYIYRVRQLRVLESPLERLTY